MHQPKTPALPVIACIGMMRKCEKIWPKRPFTVEGAEKSAHCNKTGFGRVLCAQITYQSL
jgi:hypothetical protein